MHPKDRRMSFNFKEIATATMVLFAVIDIVGSIPIIISLRKKTVPLKAEEPLLLRPLCLLFSCLLEKKF